MVLYWIVQRVFKESKNMFDNSNLLLTIVNALSLHGKNSLIVYNIFSQFSFANKHSSTKHIGQSIF